AILMSGLGFQRTRATGRFGNADNGSIALTSLTSKRNRLPISISDTFIAELASESNTSLTGSSLPPILNG
ncbi:unnamed protein product, partial [Rotaria magnacalcarata]